MLDRDQERRQRKLKRRRNTEIKRHKAENGRKPNRSERRLDRFEDEKAA